MVPTNGENLILSDKVVSLLACGFYREAVEVCATSVQKASKLIAKRSSTIDGKLFLIKHLLSLREKVSTRLSTSTPSLLVYLFVDHRTRFILSAGWRMYGGFLEVKFLVSKNFIPTLESQLDAKKDLERNLKTTCKEFIMLVTKLVVDPMLSFVTKAAKRKPDSALAKPLRTRAFATPDKVVELVQKVSATIQQELYWRK
ncbi:hypothetical protein MKX03_014203 [Papaver bracteatum]|nr:hypothetical protein MKX03_014203 [Papaver bracteatum]